MTRSTMTRHAAWLTAGYVGRSVGYLALTVLLARELDPGGYGQLALFVALAGAVAYLGAAWPFTALPLLAAQGMTPAMTFVPALLIAVGGSALFALGAVAITPSLIGSGAIVFVAIGFRIVALIGLQGAYAVLQAELRMAAIATLQTAERLCALVLVGLAFLLVDATVDVAASALAIAGVICALAALGPHARERLGTSRGAARLRFRQITSAVGLMAIVTVGTFVTATVDVLLLGALRPDSDVGRYALSYQVFTLLLQYGSLWVVLALPHEARRVASSSDTAHSLSRETLLLPVSAWAVLVALVGCLGYVLMVPLFGVDYESARGPMLVLLAGATPLALYFAGVPVLIAEARIETLAWITVGGLALNVGLDLALIPVFGPWGPAVATVVQSVATTFLVGYSVLGRRDTGIVMLASAPSAVLLIGLSAVAT